MKALLNATTVVLKLEKLNRPPPDLNSDPFAGKCDGHFDRLTTAIRTHLTNNPTYILAYPRMRHAGVLVIQRNLAVDSRFTRLKKTCDRNSSSHTHSLRWAKWFCFRQTCYCPSLNGPGYCGDARVTRTTTESLRVVCFLSRESGSDGFLPQSAEVLWLTAIVCA